jgi:hypothetical protein
VEVPCYRCGAPVEDQTPFCPSCRAPQIRVTTPASAQPDQPSTEPLPPGTPASIEPPAVPVHFAQPTPIDWKKFRRISLPLIAVSTLANIFLVPLGFLLFLACTMLAVSRYRRVHPGALPASQGAKLGAVMALLSLSVPCVVAFILTFYNAAENQQQMVRGLQQRLPPNPDRILLHLVQWIGTYRGYVIASLISFGVVFVVLLVVASLIGALTATTFRNPPRP